MNRKQRRAARSTGRTPAQADARSAQLAAELFNSAVMHHHAGALADAERAYRQLLVAFPGHAEAHSRLGAVLMRRGALADAIAEIERALALQPDMFEAYGNLAQAYLATGQSERATEAACRALELNETPQTRMMFAQCVAGARFGGNASRYRRWLSRALVEGWTRARELTRASIVVVRRNASIADAIARVDAAWPNRLPASELWDSGTIAALAQDELLCRLLESDPIPDLGLERLLTNVRGALVYQAAESTYDAGILSFCCSLARQCFINEYVFATSDPETQAVAGLRESLDKLLAGGEMPPAHWLPIAGAYLPLHALANAKLLPTQAWPQPLDELITQQIREPAAEADIAAKIPALTPIDDEVSRAVRAQYEENPYPRWSVNGPPPQASPSPPSPQLPRDALIAGCGTGLSTIEFARQAPATRILAIDLSLASLGYAKRMAARLKLGNVEFGQADILRLGALGRQFDFIDASGVLHHMADPWQGWRILLALLRPGAIMQVGLYSELGRRNIVAARAFIAARGYRPIAADIRRCRQDIIAAEDAQVASVAQRDDFFTLSECRDLLFHVQEHRTTVPEIKSFLAANGLEFGGFFVDAATRARFAARFPKPQAAHDLVCWHAFETAAPDTFAGMYQFSLRKRA